MLFCSLPFDLTIHYHIILVMSIHNCKNIAKIFILLIRIIFIFIISKLYIISNKTIITIIHVINIDIVI